MSWIVVQVNPSCEDYAFENLTRSGFKCHSPKLITKIKGKDVKVPLFRGYIFAEVEPDLIYTWKSITSHRGVQKILSSPSGKPSALPKGFVERLIEAGDALHEETQTPIVYETGQKIIFTSGPFQGIPGIVHRSSKERVSLLIKIFSSVKVVQSSVAFIAPKGTT